MCPSPPAAEALPALLGSRARPGVEHVTKQRRPRPAALDTLDEPQVPPTTEVRVKNTFIECGACEVRGDERVPQTCPSKCAGLLSGLLEEAASTPSTADVPSVSPLSIQTPVGILPTPTADAWLTEQQWQQLDHLQQMVHFPTVCSDPGFAVYPELPYWPADSAMCMFSQQMQTPELCMPPVAAPAAEFMHIDGLQSRAEDAELGEGRPKTVLSLVDALPSDAPPAFADSQFTFLPQGQQAWLPAEEMGPAAAPVGEAAGMTEAGQAGQASAMQPVPPPPSAAPGDLGECLLLAPPAEPPAPPSGPALGTSELPSMGSVGHEVGTCKPCAFLHTKGCDMGLACQFCHLCGPEERKQRRKQRLHHHRETHRSKKERQAATEEAASE